MGTATEKKSECGPAHPMKKYVEVICYFFWVVKFILFLSMSTWELYLTMNTEFVRN